MGTNLAEMQRTDVEADRASGPRRAQRSGAIVIEGARRDREVIEIVIARPRAGGRPAAEVVVIVTEPRQTARRLRDVLVEAQRDRGRGPWSDADSLVLVGGSLAARLRSHESIEDLVEHVLDRLLQVAP